MRRRTVAGDKPVTSANSASDRNCRPTRWESSAWQSAAISDASRSLIAIPSIPVGNRPRSAAIKRLTKRRSERRKRTRGACFLKLRNPPTACAAPVVQPWAYWHLGHLYASEDRLHEAEESYREAVASFEMQSSPTGVLIHHGLVYAQERSVDVLVKTGYEPCGFGSS